MMEETRGIVDRSTWRMQKFILIAYPIAIIIMGIGVTLYSSSLLQETGKNLELTCSNMCDDYIVKHGWDAGCFCSDFGQHDLEGNKVWQEIGGGRIIRENE